MDLYPRVEPDASGLLEVGEGNRVYWEAAGNPGGLPAVWVHGGPGGGGRRGARRLFDPDLFRTVLFDQRGCGESVPHAADPATSLAANTTHHLVADMEQLREHLGFERWMLAGGSWGSTLMLAYAQRHPDRVSGIVVCGVTLTRRRDVEWLYGGVARFLPRAWDAFAAGAAAGLDGPADPGPAGPGDVRDHRERSAARLLPAYGRLLADPDPDVRLQAARDWCAWEDAVIAHEEEGRPGAYSDRGSDAALVAFARICAHYFSHAAWLGDGALLDGARNLAGIPGALVHGRLDLGGPLAVAADLADAWPGAELTAIGTGHTGGPDMNAALQSAIGRVGAAVRDGRSTV